MQAKQKGICPTEFGRICREQSIPVTVQRQAVYCAVYEGGHPTIKEVSDRVNRDHPSIALGTIYKTLDFLEERGFIQKVNPLATESRYDAHMDAHHHLVCRTCEKITDLPYEATQEMKLPKKQRKDFQVEGHRVEFFGTCAACT